MEVEIFSFEKIKRSSVYITPNLPVLRTKRYKVSLLRLLFILFWYSFTVFIITITVLALTPAKKWMFFIENEKLTLQEKRIKQLEKQVYLLTEELNEIASVNKRLRFALALAGADSSIADSAALDSLRIDETTHEPAQGNIFASVVNFFKRLLGKRDKEKIIFIKPVAGYISRGFEPDKGHFGIDFAVPIGQPVHAALGGLVIFADYTTEWGYTLILKHGGGFITVYKHCSRLLKKERDYAEQGEIIALSGNTGTRTSGPHLHFEIWENGKPLNPEKFLIE